MPRQRMIKVEFFDSETLAQCSHTARLLFIGLWVMGDDYGNVKAQPRKLRMQVFPFDDMTDRQIETALCELESVGCIKGYEIGDERYITVPNFAVYQSVKKPSKSTIPEPPKTTSGELVRNWYSTSTPPVRNQYPTSTPLVPHQNAVTRENENSTPLVPHQYPTSGAQKKQTGREEESPYLRDSSSSRLIEVADNGGGVENHPPLPPKDELEMVFDEVDEQYPDPTGYEPKDMQAYAEEFGAAAEQEHPEATSCPTELLAAVMGNA